MASSKDYLQFVLEQLSELQEITYRAMMGEFIIYYRGKIVGGIYDDRLLVKPTKSAISYMPTVTYEIPYENAKEMLLVEEVDNKDFLTGLFDVMYDELPTPKPKKKNKQLLVYNFISIYTKQLVLGLTAF
ncbi:TfoX N- domain family protein [Dorea sp. D27]|nr:TfoX N- domain family protein [Dorea sp. D27]